MKRILDICISTYNRGNIVFETIQAILKDSNDEVGIIIQNDNSTDNTKQLLESLKCERLTVINNSVSNAKLKGVMYNWYSVLMYSNAKYVLYLNDRDTINTSELLVLAQFLKKNNLAGGVCNGMWKIRVFKQGEDSFVNVPYCSYHPSGIIFNVDFLHKIANLEEIFTKESCYIHPHDLVLSELTKYGSLFIYPRYVWNIAKQDSFINNKSFLFNRKQNIEEFWFHPTERLLEFEKFIIHMKKMNYSSDAVKMCVKRISKRYLFYCTYNYRFFVTDISQVRHYGIERCTIKLNELVKYARTFINGSYSIIIKNSININKFIYSFSLQIYFLLLTIFLPGWHCCKKILEFYKTLLTRRYVND